MADVAKRLAVSSRTLQRRLQAEDTSFKQELSALRAELANHYLVNTPYSSAEISFLLGYSEPSSFFRAFHLSGRAKPQRLFVKWPIRNY
jgi:AraC-like DNA-binding protein